MSIVINGELRKVNGAKTAKGKEFRKLSVLVDHGRFEDIIVIDDFTSDKRVLGNVQLNVVPSSFVSRAGYHGINYKMVG